MEHPQPDTAGSVELLVEDFDLLHDHPYHQQQASRPGNVGIDGGFSAGQRCLFRGPSRTMPTAGSAVGLFDSKRLLGP